MSFTPLPFYPRYPLDRTLGGPEKRSGRRAERREIFELSEWIRRLSDWTLWWSLLLGSQSTGSGVAQSWGPSGQDSIPGRKKRSLLNSVEIDPGPVYPHLMDTGGCRPRGRKGGVWNLPLTFTQNRGWHRSDLYFHCSLRVHDAVLN
jgi:hypothetical protein